MTLPDHAPASLPFTALIFMGVSGCGKSTIATVVAQRLGWPMIEGDDLHPPANIAKMQAGIPLSDEDRWPWLHAIARYKRLDGFDLRFLTGTDEHGLKMAQAAEREAGAMRANTQRQLVRSSR